MPHRECPEANWRPMGSKSLVGFGPYRLIWLARAFDQRALMRSSLRDFRDLFVILSVG